MTTCSVRRHSLPLTLARLEPLDMDGYANAMAELRLLDASYDPESQSSREPVFAGSRMTYDSTFSGMFVRMDDSRESDT